MTSLWMKMRDTIEEEFGELQKLLAPLEAELKQVAEEDLKDIAKAAFAAALAVLGSGKPFTRDLVEQAISAACRAALSSASVKGVQITGRAALALTALVNTPAAPEKK